MEFWDVIEGRHSVRDFRPDPVPADAIERITRAAQLAPSSQNSQPWEFYVTTGESRAEVGRIVAQTTVHLSEYMDVLGPENYEFAVKWYSSLGDAPVVIIVTMTRAEDEFTHLNRLLSLGAAIENLQLAATDAGLGSCNITFSFWVRDDLARAVGAGDDEVVVCVIALGYPSDMAPAAPPHEFDHTKTLG